MNLSHAFVVCYNATLTSINAILQHKRLILKRSSGDESNIVTQEGQKHDFGI